MELSYESSDSFLQGGVVAQDKTFLELADSIIEGNSASILALEVNTDLVIIDLQELDSDFASLKDWLLLLLLLTIFIIVIIDN